MLARVVNKVNARLYSLDNAKSINVIYLVEHNDEVTSSGGKRKRTLGRTCVSDSLDEGVYETMNDCSTREFIFNVSHVEVREGGTTVPPPRVTKDNTAGDNLHNGLLRLLEQKGVGWTRAEVQIISEKTL